MRSATMRIPGNLPPAQTSTTITREMRAFFQAIPKVELHCHLLGTIREQTFRDLAARSRSPLTEQEITTFYTRTEKPVGVLHIFRSLESHVLLQADDLYRITYEYLEDCASHTVHHSEFFWNPTGAVRTSGLCYNEAQAAIVAAMRKARADFGVSSLLIPSIDREAHPKEATAMVEWMLAHPCPEVVGIGIDYRETDRPPDLFADAYYLAREAGLKLTAHAGEFGSPCRNIAFVLKQLHVDRIDHGYTILNDPSLVEICLERGTVFTVVPSNSYYLRTLARNEWATLHPIPAMDKAGLALHPNSDDPRFHDITPSQVWEVMVSHFGFTFNDLARFMINGIDGAWVDTAQKTLWRQAWQSEFDTLAAKLLQ